MVAVYLTERDIKVSTNSKNKSILSTKVEKRKYKIHETELSSKEYIVLLLDISQ